MTGYLGVSVSRWIKASDGYSHLGPEKYQQIREMLAAGKGVAAIASAVGVGTSTVSRERERLRAKLA